MKHAGKLYPVKQLISLATGLPVQSFSGGDEANAYARKHDLEVIQIERESGAMPDQNPIHASLLEVMEGYQVASDMSGVYLTFNQGVTEPKEKLGRPAAREALQGRADRAFTLEVSDVDPSQWEIVAGELVRSAVWPVTAWRPRAIRLGAFEPSASERAAIDQVVDVLSQTNALLIQAQLQVDYRKNI